MVQSWSPTPELEFTLEKGEDGNYVCVQATTDGFALPNPAIYFEKSIKEHEKDYLAFLDKQRKNADRHAVALREVGEPPFDIEGVTVHGIKADGDLLHLVVELKGKVDIWTLDTPDVLVPDDKGTISKEVPVYDKHGVQTGTKPQMFREDPKAVLAAEIRSLLKAVA